MIVCGFISFPTILLKTMEHTLTTSPAKPRVAYLLPDAGIGLWDSRKGSSIHARSMIRAFMAEGCDVDVYVMREGKAKGVRPFKAETVRQSRLTRWWLGRFVNGRTPANWVTAVGWLLWHRDFWRHIKRRCLRRPPDLIYARSSWFAWPITRLKRLLRIPLFVEVNALFTIEKADRGEMAFAGLTRRIERNMMAAADRILPVSAEIKAQIATLGIDPEKIVVTPNAVDTDLFRPASTPPTGFKIGAVNSMRGYHGMETLLRAAAIAREKIPGLKLLLIGGGPLLDEVKSLAGSLGVADIAEFTGVIDHQDVPRRLAECSVCAAPYEGDVNQYNCPMKLFEYLAMKIPVVASRWGDIPNILADGETALLHRPADPASLAEALVAVHDDPQAAARRAESGLGLVQHHTWRATARRVLEWSRELR